MTTVSLFNATDVFCGIDLLHRCREKSLKKRQTDGDKAAYSMYSIQHTERHPGREHETKSVAEAWTCYNQEVGDTTVDVLE